uniref:DNA-directed RNA polymerase subunit beta' n=1 Tax=Chaetosphaeridium globosum TaxID=96477 RepID=RPOC1_CHAGL|nr:RNA polymerase beta' subunit [Chaetosphaeridium globosum]Q8MA11.1 RecName: Full=DNA-directed RNA polymerase subunit beta'; AltName: Full=PEP; AltName: Full=Plastid-encoded RNA polymerase subunit beta'; Short=RNA polymerase subunit beta' [Chaetosphaeridium globosum]AAM96567.1 beta' subunit of RNA polymerase [Chaetosphaeridium globosum]
MFDKQKNRYIRVELASPDQIRNWAERTLPNGEIVGKVTKPYTLHYNSHKPEKDGLFCERIFGPIKSGICACGKYHGFVKNLPEVKFCKQCGVEFTDSKVRRYRMGYIQLAYPATHIWYLKRLPSHIATLLKMSLKEVESLVYCDLFLPRPIIKKPNLLKVKKLFNYDDQLWKETLPRFFSTRSFESFQNREMATGGDAIHKRLSSLNLQKLIFQSYNEWEKLSLQRSTGNSYEDKKIQRMKDIIIRRIKLAKQFFENNIKPEWMVLSVLPVLPPELRPMIEINQGELITSDLNELYRRVIYRNNTLIGFLNKSNSTPAGLIIYQKRLVQEAVDALIDNRIGNQIMKDRNNRPYKSFSEIIEGKEGRFRQDLLGKRVDYSGRSVIVVGPSLSLHQCGIPKDMAIELFQPFIIRDLINCQLAPNLRAARSMIQNQEPIIFKILEKIIKNHPILLNRAPTLHRLGIQAFQPILVEGLAIRLHPLVCGGFNADFDGDQMAVHIPLSLEAQAEARFLMLANSNLLSPANGEPITVPSQDMLLGLYVLTMSCKQGIYIYNEQKLKKKIPYFCNYIDVITAYEKKQINLHDPIWLKWYGNLRGTSSTKKQKLFEIQCESRGTRRKIFENWHFCENIRNRKFTIYLFTTPGRIIFNQLLEQSIQATVRI